MSGEATIDLESLVGEHVLTGVDMVELPALHGRLSDSLGMRFVIDGITYEARENPDDGYRSMLESLSIVGTPVVNTFPPCRLVGTMRTERYGADVVQFIDTTTGKVVLAIGTGNVDDYYPYCVMQFTPENMAINRAAPQGTD